MLCVVDQVVLLTDLGSEERSEDSKMTEAGSLCREYTTVISHGSLTSSSTVPHTGFHGNEAVEGAGTSSYMLDERDQFRPFFPFFSFLLFLCLLASKLF